MFPFAAQIFQINISPGGVPKRPVRSAVLTERGLEGDDHNDKVHHGSLSQALCIYSLDLILALQVQGHPIFCGSTGENLTVAGLDWTEVVPGARFQIGHDILIEITDYATPCETIKESFKNHEFKRISQKVNPGWGRMYAKVLQGGTIRLGDAIFKLDLPPGLN